MEKDEDQAAELDLPSGHRRIPVRNCVRKVRASTTSSQTGGEDCGRKVKAVLSEPPSSDFTIHKKSRKRKKVHFEDDPNYSEVENEDEFSQHHRKVPGYRCSPHLIPELMEKLTDKQRRWVKNIQWHSLQDMIDSRMQKSLTMWLVDRVNTSNGTLEVCGTPIDIKKAIVRILKLPCGHIKVPPPLNGRSKAKRRKGDSSNSDQKHSDNGRGKTAKDATKDLHSQFALIDSIYPLSEAWPPKP